MNQKLSKKELKEIYESDNYVDQYHNEAGERLNRLLKFFGLKKEDKVVDFACGNGLLMDVIYNKVSSYTGVDFSEKFIQLCKKRQKSLNIKNAQFVCADIIDFCKKNTDFNKAFTMDFSEHIYDEDLLKIFEAIKNSLRKDGKLFVHTPNGDYFLEILKNKGILKQVEGHVAVRNYREYEKLFKFIGFSKVEVIYLNHYLNILRPLHIFSHLPLIGKYFKARLLIICKK